METYKSVKVLYTTSNSQNGIASTYVPAFPRVSLDNMHQQAHPSNNDISNVNIPLEFEEFSNGNNQFHTFEVQNNQTEHSFPVFLGTWKASH